MRVARSRGSAQGSSAWLEPRAVMGWRKRARRSQVAVKCLISLRTTGERVVFLSTVGRGGARRGASPTRSTRWATCRGVKSIEIKHLAQRGDRKWHKNAGPEPGTPSVRHRPMIFFGVLKMLGHHKNAVSEYCRHFCSG